MEKFFKRFDLLVEKYPNRLALIDSERFITYKQLEIESGKVFSFLQNHNIGKEQIVLLNFSRSANFFIALLGVMKAGAAFLPMENTYPSNRIEFIKQDAGIKL